MGSSKGIVKRLLGQEIRDALITAKDAARRGARAFLNRGDRVVCSCCGGSFRGFLPSREVRLRRCVCPGCDSRERHRAIMIYIRGRTSLMEKGGRVLLVAPE